MSPWDKFKFLAIDSLKIMGWLLKSMNEWRSELPHLSDMPPTSSQLTVADELESVGDPPSPSLITELTSDKEPTNDEYQEALSSGSSDKGTEAESQDDPPSTSSEMVFIKSSTKPIKLIPLWTAPKSERPKRALRVQSMQPDHMRAVFVANLQPSIDANALEEALNVFGKITKICFKKTSGCSFAFVEFKTKEMAIAAKSMSEFWIKGYKCKIGPIEFRIEVKGFAEGTVPMVLQRKFESFGEVRRVVFKSNKSVFFYYLEKKSAKAAAAEMNHFKIGGDTTLKVRTCFGKGK